MVESGDKCDFRVTIWFIRGFNLALLFFWT